MANVQAYDEQQMTDALEAMLFAAREPRKKKEMAAALRRYFGADEERDSAQGDAAADAAETAAARAGDDAAAEASETEASGTLAQATAPDGASEQPFKPTSPQTAASVGEAFALTPAPAKTPTFAACFARAFAALEARWASRAGGGIVLVEVAEGYALRTHVRFGPLLSLQLGRPLRLSKPAFETLAIVAYRQPVTKPEIDELRGVDSGNGLRVLLERELIAVVGKKEEPGRPLLYATTPAFLNVFSLPKLADLPSLEQFADLADDEQPTDLATLSAQAPALMAEDEAASEALGDALDALDEAQATARQAFLAQGIALSDDGERGATSAAGGNSEQLH